MSTDLSTASVRRRYSRIASIYDRTNLEGLLYVNARERVVELLELQPVAIVLDVACGTGANFPAIQRRIGSTGRLVGLDLTPAMLARARARTNQHRWANVDLLEADVTDLIAQVPEGPFDAVLCTLGLSVIPHWQEAWEAMKSAVRPAGRLAIMDAGVPEAGPMAVAGRVLEWPLSRLFAADCGRRPWRLLERDTIDVSTERFTWGWVTAAAGTAEAS